jgi:transglutaminase-like putative cysteine protease
MQISIRHQLSVAIGEGVPRAVQHLLLTPQSSSVQTIREWQLDAPGLDGAIGFVDAYGNRAHLSSLQKPEAELTITASGVVETHDQSGVVGRLERDPVPALFRRGTNLTKPMGAITSKFRASPKDGKERIALLHALMARVAEVLGEQSQSQSQSQSGQSQSQGKTADATDHAHAFIGAARALEIPARFVTGYLSPEEEEPAAFHAWAEAWDEGLGWIGFDAMLGLCPTERHVRMACGLDATSTMPVRSVPMMGSPQVLAVQIEIGQ